MSPSPVSQPARDRVVDLVADCVAVAALGSARPELRRLASVVGGAGGDATVIGSAAGRPAPVAAFLNGCAMAADQLQDGHRLARGHPASHVVPAVLAVAEETGASGPAFLEAVRAGYETGVRVGRAMGGTPNGVHDIGTWGTVAAAVGVASLLDPSSRARALELAGSAVLLTDAATVFAGRTGAHVYLGSSVQLGVSLGQAAAAGLAAEPGALERHLGAVAARDWTASLLDGDGDEVLQGYFKVHPTCAHLHGVNDAVDELLPLDAGSVESVEVRTFAGAAQFSSVAHSELAARFSVPTSVAVALATGRLDETTMTDDVVRSPDVVDLAERVRVVHDPDLDAGYPAGRPARVTVSLRDGRVMTASVDRPRGDADRGLSRDELAAKARRLLTHRFGAAGQEVLHAVHGLADGAPVRRLGTALRAASV